MINTIIFDLDGTLLDTLIDLRDSVNYALKENGLPQRSTEEIRKFLGNGIKTLVHLSLPSSTDEATEEKVFQCFRKHYLEHSLDATAPYNDIIEMLQQCKQNNYKTAIVSNKLDPAVKELHEHFFKQYIDIAIGETPVIRRKPAPDMVYEALKLLQSTKETSIYVGDSEVDIATAKNSGLPCISVSWGFRDKQFLIENKATTIIDSPSELLGVIS